MKTEKRMARRQEIEAAAIELIVEKGYAGASMLAVARRAGASNETLYRWYGDKIGLMRALVAANAKAAADILETAISDAATPSRALDALGPVLLRLVTSDRAVALNRAAASEATTDPSLGLAIAEAGRDAIAPLLVDLFTPHLGDRAAEAAETYIALLNGDLQIRRAIGALQPLEDAEVAQRARRATRLLGHLYPEVAHRT